jgi:hypothetical protein
MNIIAKHASLSGKGAIAKSGQSDVTVLLSKRAQEVLNPT